MSSQQRGVSGGTRRRGPSRARRPRSALISGVITAVLVAGCLAACSSDHANTSATTTRPRATSTSTTAPVPTTTPAGMPADTHDIATPFFGFNEEDVIVGRNAAAWRDPAFLSRLAQLSPGVLRLGGTTAMWIDWRTGQFVDRPDLPQAFRNNMATRQGLTLSDQASIMSATGAVPIFDLNVVTSTLDDQLQMLHQAASLGMPVRYVELGNELYDGSYPTYTQEFPTATDYAVAMNTWITQLHQDFPGVRVAVVGWDDSNPSTPRMPARIRDWNRDLLASVHGEDAVVFHTYWNLPPGVIPGTAQSVQPALHAGPQRWQTVAQRDLSQLPPGVEAWFTEWNVNGAPYQGYRGDLRENWAHGLSVGWFALASAADNRVGFSVHHDVLSGGATATIYNGDRDTVRYGFSADGDALGPIYAAFKNATAAGALTVDDAQNVLAVAVRSDHIRVVAVNLSNQSQKIVLPATMTLPAPVHTVATDVATVINGAATGPNAPTVTDSATLSVKMTIAPYSVTVIG
ncbi:MAG TPA: hypothetical protein VGI86_04715 [Acidimicrobiia bacterium]